MDLKKLISSGKASEKQLSKAWEAIIRKNYEVNGGFDYINYCDLVEGYAQLLAEYNYVRCTLIQLMFMVDDSYIDELSKRGYNIDTSNSIAYAKSINSALTRSENIVTRLTMKANEINGLIEEHGGSKPASFEEIMAGLSMSLKFSVPEEITLARFNEYKKIISERNQKVTEHGRDH